MQSDLFEGSSTVALSLEAFIHGLDAPVRAHHPDAREKTGAAAADALSKPLSRVRRRFTFPHTRSTVYDARDRPRFEIARGFINAWTKNREADST